MLAYVCIYTEEKFHSDILIQWNMPHVYYYKLQIDIEYYGTVIAAINLFPYNVVAYFILDPF